ncbi:shikimate kinase [Acholeplasma morum]|uniref:shikimate kinase n=1 Tax=Paracholeplasma morum TaxID=264637 RepID=UPI0019575057|nr:shikimate kinase [Paracholeplasma morum]MBM7453782.1 shikimate kinase [Paracholeplasma morum]
MNIYLIGMPGTGKTTIGKLLAKKLSYEFVDLDHQIEKESLMFIDVIFEQYGEKIFRELETKALKEVSTGTNKIISTGGGIVTIKENKNYMDGLVIFIDTELDIIEERIQNDFPRPLLKTKTLSTLKDERMLKYIFFADVIVSNDSDPDKTVTEILKALENHHA